MPPKVIKTDKRQESTSSQSKEKLSSSKLTQKAAGYLLAAANASKRENECKKNNKNKK